MENLIYLAPAAGIIAVIFALLKTVKINRCDAGNDKMKDIAGAIAEGARAFLFAEYKILIVFVVVLFVILGFGIDWLTAVCFIAGAVLSTLAGYVGMNVATRQMSAQRMLQKKRERTKLFQSHFPVALLWDSVS